MTADAQNTNQNAISEQELALSNKGDRVPNRPQSLEEKAERRAVDTGKLEVPAYFVFEGENGNREALHHVRDAEEITDAIRQARRTESGDRKWW